ncbi:MAG: tetratricopeptide repeat protein [Gammaproteobacteria bacterium]|nr:tetratricopeptide repeat protein [Gammaproteobacteria bacterium]MBU1481317.1 tetratricopeptide repeat protein [Gammaproteobacteria bacterium]
MNDRVPIINNETYFFRDHGQFDLLRLRLLPELIARHRATKTLRLWSAGCSSGEEAYSLAMLLDMLLPKRHEWNILILGSDIDGKALAKARRARYGQWSFRMAPTALKHRYFRRTGDEWTLDERIRNMATFQTGDLIGDACADAQLQDMDLILCRNVFIYFGTAAVAVVADKLAAALSEGGYLMTAHTELIGYRVRNLQSRLFAEGVVYQRGASVSVPAAAKHAPYINPDSSLAPNSFLPPCRGKASLACPEPAEGGVELRNGNVSTPSLALPLQGGGNKTANKQSTSIPPSIPSAEDLLASAHAFADRGDYDQAVQTCRRTLSIAPLAPGPYFLLAQLAQLKGDFEQARELLDKTLYLDPRSVAATLELASLCERQENLLRAQTLRRAALDIVRALPGDAVIEPYETTAAEMAQWLAQ